MTINVANAPGWMPGTAYAAGSRVVAGPGWTGSAFVNGAVLWLWALDGAGGTSGTVAPDPAADTAIDNGMTWKRLSLVDYVTFTDAMTDGGGVVTTYSSQAHVWLHQKVLPGSDIPTIQFNDPIDVVVWHGGVNRPVYQAGKNGESDPIPMQDHIDYDSDHHPLCMTGTGSIDDGCNGMPAGQFWTVRPAPGDSHVDRRPAGWKADAATRVDSSLGVTFFSNSPGNDNPGTGMPIGFSDSAGTFSGIQLHSANWPCCAAHGFFLPGHQHTNNVRFDQCIAQSDTGPGVMAGDGGFIFSNSLIIYLGSTPGAFGYHSGYPSIFTDTNFVGSNAPGSVAIALEIGWMFTQAITGCHMSGFDHFFAREASDLVPGQSVGFVLTAASNTSDVADPGGAVTLSLGNWGNPYTVVSVT